MSADQSQKHAGKPEGVDIIPLLKKDGNTYYILVKQFRKSISQWIIEFPSGYIDGEDNSIEDTGIRELKEETGYTANRIIHYTSKGLVIHPSNSSDSDAVLIVEVDGNDSKNKNPKQNLDDGEKVEVLLVEKENIFEYLNEIIKNGGIEISTKLYFFALSTIL